MLFKYFCGVMKIKCFVSNKIINIEKYICLWEGVYKLKFEFKIW